MWWFSRGVLLISVIFIAGCSSTSYVLRPAPQGGVQVKGLNILFSIVPFDTVTTSGTNIPTVTKTAQPGRITAPRLQTEKLRDELREDLMRQLSDKGIPSSFASHQVIPGITPVTFTELFPSDSMERHTLVITPISENRHCAKGAACSTTFTVSLSLRTPKENREVWNYRLKQSYNTVADSVPYRNSIFIDDIGKAVLAVLANRN